MSAGPSLTWRTPDGETFTVIYDGCTDRHSRWAWSITDTNGYAVAYDRDLMTTCHRSAAHALAVLLEFCSAFADAIAYEQAHGAASDNRRLFPDTFIELASSIGPDFFAMYAEDINGSRITEVIA